jgi:hypothetical protein
MGDGIKALPDDGLPDSNPFASAGTPLSTLSTSATVTQHTRSSSSATAAFAAENTKDEANLFAQGAAATSSYQGSDASDGEGAAGGQKASGWDFLLKSKEDNLRTPSKWSADIAASKSSTSSKSSSASSSRDSASSSAGLNANYFSATDLLVPGSDADTISGSKSISVSDRATSMASRVSDDQSAAVLNALGAATSAFSAIPEPPLPKEELEQPLKLPTMAMERHSHSTAEPVTYSNDVINNIKSEERSEAPRPSINLVSAGSMMNEADSQLGDLKQADPSSFALVKQLLAKNAAGMLDRSHNEDKSSDEQAQIEELLGGSGHSAAVAQAHAAGGKNWLNWKPSMMDF